MLLVLPSNAEPTLRVQRAIAKLNPSAVAAPASFAGLDIMDLRIFVPTWNAVRQVLPSIQEIYYADANGTVTHQTRCAFQSGGSVQQEAMEATMAVVRSAMGSDCLS